MILKKIVNFFGYRLVEKNKIKNEKILESSQDIGIGEILENLIEKNNLKKIIQVGANDGIKFDHLRKCIKKYDLNCILIEPVKDYFENLQMIYQNNNNIILENSAIVVNECNNYIFKLKKNYEKIYPDFGSVISSFNKFHLKKHGIKNKHIEKIRVNSITFRELINKYKVIDLDILLIDSEGMDGFLVSNFLTEIKLRPIIIFEWTHINHQVLKKTLDLLKMNNYKIFRIDNEILCFNKSKIRIDLNII